MDLIRVMNMHFSLFSFWLPRRGLPGGGSVSHGLRSFRQLSEAKRLPIVPFQTIWESKRFLIALMFNLSLASLSLPPI